MRPALVLLFTLALHLGAQTQTVAEPAEPGQEPGPGYAGPSILSRHGAASVSREGELLRLRPFISLQGLYDTGLAGVTLDKEGKPAGEAGYGLEAVAGVAGYRTWKNTVLGLDFRANGRHYDNHSSYDGVDASLNLSLEHQAGKHWVILLGESFASYSRNYYLPYGTAAMAVPDYAPSGINNLGGHDMFDSRATALSSSARAVYQPTVRASFSFGGSGFMVRRRSDALVGMQGFSASADAAYRITRYQTIGVDYAFDHYGFRSAFGSADAHAVAFNYAVRFSKYWEFRLRAGGYRIESLRQQQVAIDPVIAAIIGRNFGVETYHRILYVPNIEGNLTRRFKRSALSMSYARVLSPGNGLLLASISEGGSAGFSWTASRRVSFGFSAGGSRFSSVGQSMGRYWEYGSGGGFTYLLGKGLSLVTRLDARRYGLEGTNFERNSYRATLGVVWSPGELPLSLW